jgi:hypothetical protein
MIPKVAARDVSITVEASNVEESPNPAVSMTLRPPPRLSNTDSTWSPSTSPLTPFTPTSEKDLTVPLVDTEPEKESILHSSFVVKKGTIIFVDPPGVRE